jgi:Protein of unknown function (DUF3800)
MGRTVSRADWLASLLRVPGFVVLERDGYFDEAGIHSQSRVIVVGGFIATREDWSWLERKWSDVLKEEGAEYYHTTDIEADPPRGIYKDWTRQEADHLTDRIVPIAARFKGCAYGVHILASTWHEAAPFVQRYLPDRPHDVPYAILAKHCLETVIATQSQVDQRIRFVFARIDFSHQLLTGYEMVKKTNPRASLLGPLGVDEMAENAMLQAADLICWHYRHATEVREHIIDQPLHRAARHLIRPDDVFRVVSKEKFIAQVAALFEERGEEWANKVGAKMFDREWQSAERKIRGEEWRRRNKGRGSGDGEKR